jgi:hypothetical protein
MLGLVVLGSFNIFNEAFVDFLEMKGEIFCCGSRMNAVRAEWDFRKETGMKAIICEEGGHLGGFLGGAVVGEFCKGKQAGPVILLIVAEDTEVGLEGLIHSFSLTVSLGMKGCGFPRVNLKDGSEGGPEVGRENRTTVRDNGIRKAVELDDVGDKELCEFGSRRGLETGDEVGHLGHSVNKHEDGVVAIRNRQISDEIARESFPWGRGDRERSQLSMTKVTWGLCLLTQKARVNIISNKGLNAGEPVIPG